VHICRKYKPEKVYLYLSQEMLAFHQQDDRYCRCLKWLQEKDGRIFGDNPFGFTLLHDR
jgi:hypothetical protein